MTLTAEEITKEPKTYILNNKRMSKTTPGKMPVESVPIMDEIWEPVLKDGKPELNGDGSIKGRNRTIRYIPGEKSIFVDEQSYKPGDKIPYSEIVIRDAIKRVDRKEAVLVEYLSKCNYNGSNPDRREDISIIFYEQDHKKEAEDYLKEDKEDVELKWKIHNMKADEIMALAMVLGVRDYKKKEVSELRMNIRAMANNDSKRVSQFISDPNVKRKYHLLEAIEMGIMISDRKAGTVSWPDGEVFINSPIDVDPIDHLVDYTMKDGEGKVLYKRITKRLYPDGTGEEEEGKEDTQEDDKEPASDEQGDQTHIASDIPDRELTESETLLKEAIELGVVEQKGFWHKFKGEDKSFANGKFEKVAKTLEANSELSDKMSALVVAEKE